MTYLIKRHRKPISVGLTRITIIRLPLFYFHLRQKVNYTRSEVSLMWCRPGNHYQLRQHARATPVLTTVNYRICTQCVEPCSAKSTEQ